MKHIKAIVAILFAGFAAIQAHAQTPTEIPDPLYVKKTVEQLPDGKYKLTMEQFVSGENRAADIVIVMDFSASMDDDVSGDTNPVYAKERKLTAESKQKTTIKGKTSTSMVMSPVSKPIVQESKTIKTTSSHFPSAVDKFTKKNGSYSYTSIESAPEYMPFILYNNTYYKVHRENSLTSDRNRPEARALWVMIDGNRRYLRADGSLSEDYDNTIRADGTTIYSGDVYYGWSYYNINTSTAAGESQYCYLYGDDYYPVRKRRVNVDTGADDNNGVYALFFELNDGTRKFLWADGIADRPDASLTNAYYMSFLGTLYNNGWTYASVTNHYYELNGVLYPVHKSQEGSSYTLWIQVGNNRKYLKGEGLADDFINSVNATNQSIFFGTLYSGTGGWTYNNIGDNASYSFLYENNYYPVKRGRFNPDGTANASGSVYAIYIEINGSRKFLVGNSLWDKPYELTVADTPQFSGTLYKSGWTFGSVSNHFYPLNDIWYPVHKSQEGSSYTLWIEENGVRRYLRNTGLDTNYEPSVTATTSNVFFGTLYNGNNGWSYYDVGGDESKYSYCHNGDYYPVKRGRFNSDGTANASGSVYAIYIELGDGSRKFLVGNSLSDKLNDLATSNTFDLFSGTLYSDGWTYTQIGADDAYVYLYNGVYYPVKRSNSLSNNLTGAQERNDVRALWIETPEGKKYLRGDGLASDYVNSVYSDSQGIFYGTLYSGGWTYNGLQYGNETGWSANQWYYLHENGTYYPVHRANNLPDAYGRNQAKAMWICLNPDNTTGIRYLSGQGLSENYDNTITSTDGVLYMGTLYKGWTYTNASSGYWYQFEDGNLYKVETATNVDNGHEPNSHQLYFKVGNQTYYLSGATYSVNPNPYASTNNDISLYFGDLYYYRSKHIKADYLIKAVEAFIGALAEDAELDELNHRIALTEFNSGIWTSPDNATNYELPYLKSSPLDANSRSHVISDFLNLLDVTNSANSANIEAMKNALALPHPVFHGGSYYAHGLSLANGLFQRELGSEYGTDINGDGTTEEYELPTLEGSDHDQYSTRPKFVILVGDCEWADGGNNGNAVKMAKKLKEDTKARTFVVVITKSSTYEEVAKKMAYSNEYVRTVQEFNQDLVDTFVSLAEDVRRATIELGKSTIVRDIVGDGFSLAETPDNVKVYTARYATGKNKNDMTFDEPVAADDSISVTINEPVIEVTNFDFTENYCGTVSGVKRGVKLILEALIERKDETVGGPAVETNAAGSGIVNGSTLYAFETPTVDLPVNIQIRKEGLPLGESAIFTVQPVDSEGNPITSVTVNEVTTQLKPFRLILTGDGSDHSVAELKGLNKNCHWLITEEGWSWNYIVNGGDPSLSTANQLFNPFIFTNVKQDTTIKSAESKVTNDFKTGTATQVNSKVQ